MGSDYGLSRKLNGSLWKASILATCSFAVFHAWYTLPALNAHTTAMKLMAMKSVTNADSVNRNGNIV
jgi:hypothetical protein